MNVNYPGPQPKPTPPSQKNTAKSPAPPEQAPPAKAKDQTPPAGPPTGAETPGLPPTPSQGAAKVPSPPLQNLRYQGPPPTLKPPFSGRPIQEPPSAQTPPPQVKVNPPGPLKPWTPTNEPEPPKLYTGTFQANYHTPDEPFSLSMWNKPVVNPPAPVVNLPTPSLDLPGVGSVTVPINIPSKKEIRTAFLSIFKDPAVGQGPDLPPTPPAVSQPPPSVKK